MSNKYIRPGIEKTVFEYFVLKLKKILNELSVLYCKKLKQPTINDIISVLSRDEDLLYLILLRYFAEQGDIPEHDEFMFYIKKALAYVVEKK